MILGCAAAVTAGDSMTGGGAATVSTGGTMKYWGAVAAVAVAVGDADVPAAWVVPVSPEAALEAATATAPPPADSAREAGKGMRTSSPLATVWAPLQPFAASNRLTFIPLASAIPANVSPRRTL